jgi:hypothetical protein
VEPLSVVNVDVVVEDGVAVRKLGHLQLSVLRQIDFQLFAIGILKESSQRPHHAENEDLKNFELLVRVTCQSSIIILYDGFCFISMPIIKQSTLKIMKLNIFKKMPFTISNITAKM